MKTIQITIEFEAPDNVEHSSLRNWLADFINSNADLKMLVEGYGVNSKDIDKINLIDIY